MTNNIIERINKIEELGFVQDWQRELYYNKESHQIVSREFLENATDEDFLKISNNQWTFYFIENPSDKVKKELIDIFDNEIDKTIKNLIDLLTEYSIKLEKSDKE